MTGALFLNGYLAQLGERFLHTEEVVGSIPIVSTRRAVLAQLAVQLICNQ